MKGATGTPCGSSTRYLLSSAWRAKRELVAFRHRKTAGWGRRLNIQRAKVEGVEVQDKYWLLIDHSSGERLKVKLMNKLSAFLLNKMLRGTGFSWNQVDPFEAGRVRAQLAAVHPIRERDEYLEQQQGAGR